MTVWYNTLPIWQQSTLWVLIILSVAGIMRLLYLCNYVCWRDKRLVQLYIENAGRYAKKFRSNQNNSDEGEFLLRKSTKVSSILEENVYDMPALKYASIIKHGNVYSVTSLDDLVRKIYANYLKWDEQRKGRMGKVLLQLFLPFVFWPFRGIEAFFIFLSEVLRAMGFKSFKVDGKSIHILSVVGGVLGFFGNMASILSFLGVSFCNNGQ